MLTKSLKQIQDRFKDSCQVTEINSPNSAPNIDGIWTFSFSSFTENCVFLYSFPDTTLLHHRVFWLITVGTETSSSHGMTIN